MSLPDLDQRADQAAELEQQTARAASGSLRVELGQLYVTWLAAYAHGARGAGLRTLIANQLDRLHPNARSTLEAGAEQARRLGQEQHGGTDAVEHVNVSPSGGKLTEVISSSDDRAKDRLIEAATLAGVLPLETDSDLTVVIAKANTAPAGQETDAGWVVHRGVALGVADVAQANDQRVVWVAERNACLHCLAYQGHVVVPGRAFPPGLTYGDHPLTPYGLLVGPPLHPHCRCQLEPTDIAAGEIDVPLAREAARSVARGLTDYSSEAGRLRATDRLVHAVAHRDAAALLPRSVRERAARNVADRRFRFRPGSAGAKAEIMVRRVQRRTIT